MTSVIDAALGQTFSGAPFSVKTVEPKRTFLKKAFLIHEELSKPHKDIRHERMSRHLYDLERLMDTEHGLEALRDWELYQSILTHRQTYNRINSIEYYRHNPSLITFIPKGDILKKWESDYRLMKVNMIYGEAPSFKNLISRLEDLTLRFRAMKPSYPPSNQTSL